MLLDHSIFVVETNESIPGLVNVLIGEGFRSPPQQRHMPCSGGINVNVVLRYAGRSVDDRERGKKMFRGHIGCLQAPRKSLS